MLAGYHSRMANELREALDLAHRLALAHLDADRAAHVGPTASAETLRARFLDALPARGLAPTQTVDELAAAIGDGLMRSTGGRFYAWVIGGTLPAALAADWLTSAWDQNAGSSEVSPASAAVEEAVGRWLKKLFALPEESAYALVTGCQMAHVTCLAAARHAVLARIGWDVGERGLAGSPPIRVLTTPARHVTVIRALRLVGIGAAQVEELACDAQGRLDPAALERALADGAARPAIVVVQAGDLNLGTFDDFGKLVPIARRAHAWVHVDGAFGLWARASDKYRDLARGIEGADSWATDGHKWLNVPYDCGYAFVRDPEALRAAMTYHASYLSAPDALRNPGDYGPEFSRRARGFASYAALRSLGTDGVAALVDRCCAHARALVDAIGELDRAEVLWRPVLNQGLVRFRDASGADDDAYTERVIQRIRADGEAFFGGVVWNGRRAMRVSVSNWITTAEDVSRAAAAVAKALSTT